jgi:CHASE3 domain sensor protein
MFSGVNGMKIIKKFVLVIVCGVFLVGCSGKYITDMDQNITQAEQEKEKLQRFYNEVLRPQAVSIINRTESTYDLYFGSSLMAKKTDSGIQDFVYKKFYPQADDSLQQRMAKLDRKVLESYKKFQDTKKKLTELDQTIKTKFEDFDAFIKEARNVVGKLRDVNKQANNVVETIGHQLKSL